MVLRFSLLMLAAFAFASPAGAQVTKSEVPGVTKASW